MPISISDLAKKLEIAPEAVALHAMDLDFDIPDDEIIPDNIAAAIEKAEIGDDIAQLDHELEEQMDREIVEKQAAKTAGQKKVPHKTKKKEEEDAEEVIEIVKSEDGTLILPEEMTVRQLAIKISKPIPLVLVKLKQNGIVANLAQTVDYETAAIIAEEMGVKVKKEAAELTGEDLFRGNLSEILADEEQEYLVERPPVVSIMGHVDHGKTSILDYIRKTKVVDGEAGGITQSIGAYQVDANGKKITFLDTPGHEAFTTMRARGARATDIAILVVAATEGLKPQSIEAINHAKAAEIPVIVAINKMDLDGANPDLVKGQLAEHGLNPDDWGGDTPCVPVSAKTGLGIDKLIETIQLMAEMRELKANPNRNAIGTIIESTMDKKSGISATILVNTGTLSQGDAFVIYDQNGKIRVMKNHKGEVIKQAPPSTPVLISGFNELPRAGDLLQVMESDKVARKKAEEVASIKHEDDVKNRQKFSLATLKSRIAEGKLDQLKVIVKADSKGSLEAVVAECEKAKTEGSMAKVVHSGVGEITESDVMLAAAGETVLVGFNVKAPGRVEKLAEREGVELLTYDVIYHLSEKLVEILEGRVSESDTETIVGEFAIKKVFAANKKMAVLGGEILAGKVRKLSQVRIFRKTEIVEDEDIERTEAGEELVGHAKIDTVQRGSEAVNELTEVGLECGMKIEHNNQVFEEGDRLELFVKKN
ncbi:translation initiation factor IF-2 [bacterium]|nr:translation initiation factor IF-2 [bacterium]NCQ55371.1 translation initiation factor IF-2 [Candidatus Parcubacteria bacterium]NCS67733.1 translation initiation factor IF-2 [Candidatus Peregrinibacteria bacterium]NCS96453.1 translation initiation factor IF-2 [bacterium]